MTFPSLNPFGLFMWKYVRGIQIGDHFFGYINGQKVRGVELGSTDATGRPDSGAIPDDSTKLCERLSIYDMSNEDFQELMNAFIPKKESDNEKT